MVTHEKTNKNIINLIQLSIINSTPIFKLNEQIIKKGKRKANHYNGYAHVRKQRRQCENKCLTHALERNKKQNTTWASVQKEQRKRIETRAP